MMPTVEANAKSRDGRVGYRIRTEYRESFYEALKSKLQRDKWDYNPDTRAWWIAKSELKKVEKLMLQYWNEIMRVGGDDDGAIVTRDGVVAVQGRLL